MKQFIKYFFVGLFIQPVVLYILAFFGFKSIWEAFYDPIFKFAADSLRNNGIEIGFAVIPIFLIVLIVFSSYAAVIAGLIMFVKKKSERIK